MLRSTAWKVIFSLALLLLAAGQAMSTRAQDMIPTDPCRQDLVARYEAWIKDQPCLQLWPEAARMAAAQPPAQAENNSPMDWVHVVFSSARDDNWEVYYASHAWDYDGLQNPSRLTNHAAADMRPRLRPGSRQVAFSSDRTGDYELYLVEWGTGSLQQLTSDPAYDSMPAWSLDGTQLIFVSDRAGNMEIFRMLADGTGLTRLTYDSATDFHPYWSPDGTQITWIRALDQQHGAVYMMNADGSNPHALTGALLYPQHPVWSTDGTQIAFDYDVNLDGWSDMALMNADGSNLQTLAQAPAEMNYWAGAWVYNQNLIVLSRIQYILYQGQYYIQSTCVATMSASGSSPGCLGYSYLDLYPDAAMLDTLAPETHVLPQPEYQRAAPLAVTAVGQDVGLSGLYRLATQYRVGADGVWQNLGGVLHYSTYTWNFNAAAGTQVYFRSQGEDFAVNIEPWPDGDGDTFTRVFQWELFGQVVDPRGQVIANAQVATSPVFADQVDADIFGRFHRYVPVAPVTVTVNHAGYGALPDTALTNQTDRDYLWVLPPQQDAVVNGGFEAGLTGWSLTGDYEPLADQLDLHTGGQGAMLGRPEFVTPPITAAVGINQWATPVAVADAVGNLHLLWTGQLPGTYVGHVFYNYRPITGTWSSTFQVDEGLDGGAMMPSISLGPDGTLHAVWFTQLGSLPGTFYYAYRTPEGTWSQVYDLSGPRYVWTPTENGAPYVDVDSQNTVHVIWGDQDGIWYLNKPAGGAWTTPLNISFFFTTHAMAIGPDDTLYILGFNNNLVYLTRSPSGVWLEHALPFYVTYLYGSDIAVDEAGDIHIVWRSEYTLYYAKCTGGQWTTAWQVVDENAYTYHLTTANNQAFLVWRGATGLHYRRQFNGDAWSPTFDLRPAAASGWSFWLLARGDHVQFFWLEDFAGVYSIAYTEWDAPQQVETALSQVVAIPADMHAPTLSAVYAARQLGTGGVFDIRINDTVVYSSAEATADWTHLWFDLTPWAGQTVTVTFGVANDFAQGLLEISLDDVTLGAWLTPVIEAVSPATTSAWVSTTLLITGQNFVATPTVYLNNSLLPGVQWLDAQTLRIELPGGLAPGIYDLKVVNPDGQVGLRRFAVRVGQLIYIPLIVQKH